MLKVGDTVKVIGVTIDGESNPKEYISIGTICTVVDIGNDSEVGPCVCILPNGGYPTVRRPYWYSVDTVEKGHMEWIKEYL